MLRAVLSSHFVLEQKMYKWNKDEVLIRLSYLVHDFKSVSDQMAKCEDPSSYLA